MSDHKIVPEKITKPIQLLAAWLIGLILINGSFLTASAQISNPSWAAGALIIATIVNVPLFLISLFLLQTRFRPEMQEDSYYSKYLEQKYNNDKEERRVKKLKKEEEKETEQTINEILQATKSGTDDRNQIKQIIRKRDKIRIKRRVEDSRALSELHMHSDKWDDLIKKWGDSPQFIKDIEELLFYNIITGSIKKPENIKLTPLGKEIAKELEDENKLFNQVKGRF